jgi:N,N'-diacetyllegionaminate synthase
VKIGPIDLREQVLIVAEVGNNHEGDFTVAQEMVRQAAASGAHAVKFQTFQTRYFVSPHDSARYKRLVSFELTYDQFASLAALARSHGLLFISTPLDLPSARFLDGIVDSFKVASGDNDFYALMEYMAGTGKPVIISTGMSDMAQVLAAKRCVETVWRAKGIAQELAILHCVSSYPAPPAEINLSILPRFAAELGCTIGYSDHTDGIEACVLAVALGARIIEKHFTLDKHYSDFRDHQLSADPPEMKRLVGEIARAQTLLGRPEKKIQPCEEPVAKAARRSIAAIKDLPGGHVLTIEDFMWIRPSGGVRPGDEATLLGRRLRRAVSAGDQILRGDVQ